MPGTLMTSYQARSVEMTPHNDEMQLTLRQAKPGEGGRG